MHQLLHHASKLHGEIRFLYEKLPLCLHSPKKPYDFPIEHAGESMKVVSAVQAYISMEPACHPPALKVSCENDAPVIGEKTRSMNTARIKGSWHWEINIPCH
jgi:hypothetical protein